jgi:hypothetical protein
MTRVEQIKKRITEPILITDSFVISSLIYALTSEEACDILDLDFQQDYKIRRYILRKLLLDMSKNFSRRHKQLVSSLLSLIKQQKFSKKESCAYSIAFLYSSLPKREKGLVLKEFLNSNNSRCRDRAYKIIKENWSTKYESKIEKN